MASAAPTKLEIRLVRAGQGFWHIARDHTIGFTVAFVAAFVAVLLASWRADMSHDLWILILQGLIGPAILGVFVFCYCYIKAGDQIIDEKDAEIRRLSSITGDAVLPPSEPAILSGLGETLRHNAGNIVVLLAGLAFTVVVYNSIQAKHHTLDAEKKLAVLMPLVPEMSALEKKSHENEISLRKAWRDVRFLKDQLDATNAENDRLRQRNRELLIALEKVCSMVRGTRPVECKLYLSNP